MRRTLSPQPPTPSAPAANGSIALSSCHEPSREMAAHCKAAAARKYSNALNNLIDSNPNSTKPMKQNLSSSLTLIGALVLVAYPMAAQTFATLYSFTAASNSPPYGNIDGISPQAPLILSGNALFGTAHGGGGADSGTAFKLNTNGTGFANLHSFTARLGPNYTNND